MIAHEEQYASALLGALERGMPEERALARLTELLRARGKARLLPRIARALRLQLARHSRTSLPALTIAREKDRAPALAAIAAHMRDARAAAKGVRIVLDERIIGGWIFAAGSTRIDASYRARLEQLYRHITR